jgi:hypothetical protein
MKITAYNHHARLLSSRATWSFSRNQFTQVEGADAVMQSSIARHLRNEWEWGQVEGCQLDRNRFPKTCRLSSAIPAAKQKGPSASTEADRPFNIMNQI